MPCFGWISKLVVLRIARTHSQEVKEAIQIDLSCCRHRARPVSDMDLYNQAVLLENRQRKFTAAPQSRSESELPVSAHGRERNGGGEAEAAAAPLRPPFAHQNFLLRRHHRHSTALRQTACSLDTARPIPSALAAFEPHGGLRAQIHSSIILLERIINHTPRRRSLKGRRLFFVLVSQKQAITSPTFGHRNRAQRVSGHQDATPKGESIYSSIESHTVAHPEIISPVSTRAVPISSAKACECRVATGSRRLQSRICVVAVHQPGFARRLCILQIIKANNTNSCEIVRKRCYNR